MESGTARDSSPQRAVDFLVTSYLPDEEGKLLPIIPCRCLHSNDGETCHITIHHWHHRATGPLPALAVICCGTHASHYTLYPPSMTPFGRKPLVHVDTGGELVESALETPDIFENTRLEVRAPPVKRAVDGHLPGANAWEISAYEHRTLTPIERTGVISALSRHAHPAAALKGLQTIGSD